MEKLTELSGKHKLIKDGISISAVANKLYDYEDTNLTPEDCKELIKLKGHNEHPSDNAVAHICVTLDKDGGCEQIVYGSGKKILMLIAGVIHTMANGDIAQEAMLLANLKSKVADVTIGEVIKNPEGIKVCLQNLQKRRVLKMAICSDIVINPVPKPAKNKAKKVKVRCRNNPYSDECDFMMRFWEACSSYGARTFDRESQNYIICCSKTDALVYSFPTISDYGSFIPYFPDEQSAEAVIKELGMENLVKYYFNRKDDYKWNLPF